MEVGRTGTGGKSSLYRKWSCELMKRLQSNHLSHRRSTFFFSFFVFQVDSLWVDTEIIVVGKIEESPNMGMAKASCGRGCLSENKKETDTCTLAWLWIFRRVKFASKAILLHVGVFQSSGSFLSKYKNLFFFLFKWLEWKRLPGLQSRKGKTGKKKGREIRKEEGLHVQYWIADALVSQTWLALDLTPAILFPRRRRFERRVGWGVECCLLIN